VSHIETHSHAIASLFQSLAETVAQRIDEKKGATGKARPTVSHPMAATASAVARHIAAGEEVPSAPPADLTDKHGPIVESVWDCAKISAELLVAKAEGNTAKAAQLEDDLKFSTCDPHWIEAITDYVEFFGLNGKKQQIPYASHWSATGAPGRRTRSISFSRWRSTSPTC
jgi:hypothetical protein